MFKRTWIITGEITRDDLEWVFRSKLEFMQGEQHYHEVVDITTLQPLKIAGKLDPSEIVTTNEKEETWLKLYFADRAILIAEEEAYKYRYAN
jgi:hypothetical protein